MKKMFCAALALLGTAAMAAVTLNADGTGFVGKGDVQIPFGFNNATMQAKAASTSFNVVTIDSYSAVCSWVTAEGKPGEKPHNVPHVRSTSVDASVAADPRKTGQWTGWTLKGYGTVSTTGTLPVVGNACMGNEGHGGTWSSVTLQSSSGAGLYATIDGVSQLIYSAP